MSYLEVHQPRPFSIKEWVMPITVALLSHAVIVMSPVLQDTKDEPAKETVVMMRFAQPAPTEQKVAKPVVPDAPVATRQPTKPKAAPIAEAPRPKPLATPKPVKIEQPVAQQPIAKPAVQVPQPSIDPAQPVEPADKRSMRDFSRSIYSALNAVKEYPVVAEQLRMQGRVLIQLTVRRDGTLIGNAKLYQSSGHSILDEQALAMVASIKHFDTLPSSYAKQQATIVVPVDFKLS